MTDFTPDATESVAIRGIGAIGLLASETEDAAGWFLNKERNFAEVIALCHSELSEALEADREDLTSTKIPGFSGIEEEFADTIIRIMATAHAMRLDVGGAIVAKNRYNRSRIDHDPKTRVKKY